jgi:hypothetical protein
MVDVETLRLKRWIMALIIITSVAFVLLPVVPYSASIMGVGSGATTVTANVSPAYELLGCGLVWGIVIHYPYSASQSVSSNGEFLCETPLG